MPIIKLHLVHHLYYCGKLPHYGKHKSYIWYIMKMNKIPASVISIKCSIWGCCVYIHSKINRVQKSLNEDFYHNSYSYNLFHYWTRFTRYIQFTDIYIFTQYIYISDTTVPYTNLWGWMTKSRWWRSESKMKDFQNHRRSGELQRWDDDYLEGNHSFSWSGLLAIICTTKFFQLIQTAGHDLHNKVLSVDPDCWPWFVQRNSFSWSRLLAMICTTKFFQLIQTAGHDLYNEILSVDPDCWPRVLSD